MRSSLFTVPLALLLGALLACKGNSSGDAGDAAPAPVSPSPAVAAVAPTPEPLQKPDFDPMGIYQKVADDSIAQYGMVKRNGTKIEVCVHAGMVAAAFLQAKNEEQYIVWKKTQKADCAKAGMPAM